MESAAKVGGLVILFLVMIVGVLSVLQASVFKPKRDTYYISFRNAGGINAGSPVLMSGVQVGTVEKIELKSPTRALVSIAVDHAQSIPIGSKALLPTSFVSIGDKQLMIEPPATIGESYRPNNFENPIPGALQGPLDGILPDSQGAMTELTKTMAAFRKLMEDQQLKSSLVGVMDSGKQTSEKFGNLAGHFDSLLTKNESNIDAMVRSMSVSLNNLQVLSEKVKDLAANGELEGKTKKLLDNLNEAVVQGNGMVKDLRAYTGDPKTKEQIDKTVSNFATMSDSGTRIAADAEKMAKNGVEISGKTADLMDKANKLADKVGVLIDEFTETVQKFKGGGKKILPDIGVEATLTRQSDPNHYRTDIDLLIPAGQETVRFGLYDAFESNKIDLELERKISDVLGLRYGIYASKPAIGVDFSLAPRLWLRSDVFGLNSTQFDVRLRYDFGSGVNGWLGVERIFERNSPSFGIGIKR